MGPTFVQRVQQDTGADVVTIARAYVVAREVCQAGDIWNTIEALDNKLPATAQQTMMFEVSRVLRHACYWLIDRFGDELDIVEAVDHLKEGMALIYSRVFSFVSPLARERLKKVAGEQVRLGAPDKLARKMSELLLSRGGLDISDLARIHKKDTVETAKMYSDLSDRLGFIWLNRCVEDLEVEGRWQAVARSNLRDEFYRLRRELAGALLRRRGNKSPAEVFEAWLATNIDAVRQFDAVLAEMRLRPESDFAVLSVAAQEIRKLTNQ
jgi:glutamate dehydrogenase